MLAGERFRLLVGVCFVTCVAADAGDDFANNLFSDLAPLLALFGERVTMQFMSQSMGWADNIILAMVPLGIITAIVGAIRVSGPSWLKAIIGRARETRAVAESELMSSTSAEVCELWNGQEIVRVMGSGPIREFIVLMPENIAENGGKVVGATTPTEAGLPRGTGSGSVEKPKDDRKVIPGILVMELKDALKPKDAEGGKGARKPYLTEYRPTLRERIFGYHIRPRPDPSGTKGVLDGKTVPDPEKGLQGSDPPEVHNSSSSEESAEFQPSIVIIRNTDVDTPNLTLNVHNQVGRGELYVVALCGLILQVGVLVYSGIAAKYLTFRLLKDGNPVAHYTYPCTAAGTLLLVLGMLICAHVVESSTLESRYRPAAGKSARVVWMQRSGTVNDQLFESFAIFPNNAQALITTSERAPRRKLRDLWLRRKLKDLWLRARRKLEDLWLRASEETKTKQSELAQSKKTRWERFLEIEVEEVMAVTGSMVSVCGFIVQFIGLRGSHWSASVAQLGATIVMTILRVCVRRNLAKNPACQPLLRGHEMDWLAMTLEHLPEAPWLHPSKVDGNIHRRPWADDGGWDWKNATVQDPAELERKLAGRTPNTEKENPPQVDDNGHDAMDQTHPVIQGRSSDSWSNASRVMKIRRDLGQLADWHGPASAEAISLARAIEVTMDDLRGPPSVGQELFTWSLKALKSSKGDAKSSEEDACEWVTFHVTWHAGKWKAYCDEIEAALSLWLYSVDERENKVQEAKEKEQKQSSNDGSAKETQREDGVEWPKDDTWLRKETSAKPSLRLLGSRTAALWQDLQWWMPGGAAQVIEVENYDSTNTSEPMEEDAHRVVGFAPSPGKDASYQQAGERSTANVILAAESYTPLKTLYVQHMFSVFMCAAAKKMEPIEDKADVRLAQTDGVNGDLTWQSITLYSIRLSKLAQAIQGTGLGSLEDVYLAMVPPLSRENKLLRTNALIEWTREHAKPHERLGHWKEATDAYLWLFQGAKALEGQSETTTTATALLMEYLRAVTDAVKLRKIQLYNKRDILELERVKSKLEDGLRKAGVSGILAGIMGLFEVQGRPWECFLVENEKKIEKEDTMLNFKAIHGIASRDDAIGMETWWEQRKGNINEKDILDWTPLHYAAAKPSSYVFSYLLTYRADVNARDIRGRTPLHYACWHNDARVVQSLLREGAEINSQDMDGMAPIHHAAVHGHQLTMQSLIKAGADVNLVDALGNTPLFWAAYKGHKILVDKLWKNSNTRLRDHNGRTSLHLAAIVEVNALKEEVAKLLLDRGVDTEAKDRFGWTPLHLAAESGHKEVAALLLDQGADTEAKEGTTDRTPLHLAAEGGHKEVAVLLLDQGANIEVKNISDYTPLHLAAEGGHEVAALLLDQGADIEAKNASDYTPLHLAAEGGHKEVAALLLDWGANVEAKNFMRETPLSLADKGKHQDVATMLRNRGATQ